MRQRHLIVFAKPPRIGRAKRRLAADIGTTDAIRFYRSTLAATLRRLGGAPHWHTWLFVDKGDARWPRGISRHRQTSGNLGTRMEKALRSMPPGPVVLIGSDIPDARPDDVRAAFRILENRHAVFGPATDGGYWLVGLAHARAAPRLFESVRWSTEHALADTLRNISRPRGYRLAPVRGDIDDGVAFLRWREESDR